jgi:hypothetical protein
MHTYVHAHILHLDDCAAKTTGTATTGTGSVVITYTTSPGASAGLKSCISFDMTDTKSQSGRCGQ